MMKAFHCKILAGSTLLGSLAGILIISPFAMTVSNLVHQHSLGFDAMSFPDLVLFSLKGSIGPNPAMWYVTHAVIGALLALLFGIFFVKLLKEVEVRHAVEIMFRREEMTLELGKLVRGIVHNISNHLAIIDGYLEMMKGDYAKDAKLDAVLKASFELKAMTKAIMEHSGGKQSIAAEVDLNAVIRKNLEFLKGNSFFKHEVTTLTELAPDLPKITGQEIDFSQCIYNLLDNAVDAMMGSPKKELKIKTYFNPHTIYIDVIDSGEGIPKEILCKLFTSGFTTKPFTAKGSEPTGTGFGLANVKDLLRPYHAKVDVSSQPGETRFTLLIPRYVPNHT